MGSTSERNSTRNPRTRALATLLREARDSSGLSVRGLAGKLGVAHTTVSRWETGFNVPNLADVATALAHLGVSGAERTKILAVAQDASQPDWLASGMSEAVGGAAITDMERTATNMTEWSPLLVPGLLQTADYARAILARSTRPGPDVETRVLVRLGRRDALTRPRPMRLAAMVGEPALYGGIGGNEVMLDQLRHLLAMTRTPTVTVRVAPVSSDWHPGLMGSFILYNFDGDPPIVYLEHYRADAFLYHPGDVAGFQDASETLGKLALSPDDTRDAIEQAIRLREATA